jgi:hypothetical protein
MWPAEWPDKVGDTTIAEALLETILGPEEEAPCPPTWRPAGRP